MPRRPLLLAGILALLPSSFLFAGKGDFKVEPGPNVISEEEKAIQADPARGMEHGVVLAEETERDERLGTDTEIRFHFRAKILSKEGESLGNVEIPLNTAKGQLKQWWGYVLLPDGSHLVLRQEDLKPQEIQRGGSRTVRVLKAMLPGVGPGCVIDYGYDFYDVGMTRVTRLSLQSAWPIRSLRYRWLKYPALPSSYRLTHTEALDVQVSKEGASLTLAARNMPAVVEEPYMPAEGARVAMATMYYVSLAKGESPDNFWDFEAKQVDKSIAAFASEKEAKEAIQAMHLPDGPELTARLRAAYDWIAGNVRNRSLLTSEEEEQAAGSAAAEGRKGEREIRSASDLIAAKEGWGGQIVDLFVVVARALGAEANVVRATDRTDHYWDPLLLTMDQFDWSLAAVRAPGDPNDKAEVVAPGSGLRYGQIPWWLTGTNGWMATSAGGRDIKLYPADIRQNLFESKAEILFAPDGSIQVHWSADYSGQNGYLTWRRMRRMTPDERSRRLDELCGASGELEIAKATGPDPNLPTAGMHLDCEGSLTAPPPDESAPSYTFDFTGPWTGLTPDLTASTRFHPVVFDFPWVDRSTIDVASPPGFVPKGAPPPIVVEERFARCTVTFTATATGYHVVREHQFAPLLILPDEYPLLREYLAGVRRADKTLLEFTRHLEKP